MHQSSSSAAKTSGLLFASLQSVAEVHEQKFHLGSFQMTGSPKELTSHLPLKKRFNRTINPSLTPYARFSSPVMTTAPGQNYWPTAALLQSYSHHLHLHPEQQTPLQLLSTVSALRTVSESFGALDISSRSSISGSHISPSAFSSASSSRLSDVSADSGFADEQQQLQQPLDLSINSSTSLISRKFIF